MLTIYTKPGCHPCRLTIKTANKLGLNYQEKPAQEHTDYLATLGHASAPVVVNNTTGDSFSGPDPRKVDTSGVSYAAWVSVADVSASKSLVKRPGFSSYLS